MNNKDWNRRFVATARRLGFLLLIAFSTLVAAAAKDISLTASEKMFLSQYENLRASLAADDLPAAKKAAAAIAESAASPHAGKEREIEQAPSYIDAAKRIAEAKSLRPAREAFKTLSRFAVDLTDGQKGYYHLRCSMVPRGGGDWIQTTNTVGNPYFGKSMLNCGDIVQ
jgi:Cu(I)/Ag(I) efflux system membrane fusion protein